MRAAGQKRLFLFLSALLLPRAAAAQAPTHARVSLEYVAPPELSCPDRDAFASAIATRLGYDAVTPDAAEDAKRLTVAYRRETTAIHVTLRLSNAARELEAEKSLVSETGACAELGAAAAFAAAILLDPRAMFPRPQAPGASLDSHAPGTWPWYEPPTLPPPPPPPPPWRFRAGLAGAACVGCAPSLSAGGALFVGVAKDRLGLDLGVRADLPVSTTEAGTTIRASVILGEVFPHLRVGPARLGVLGAVGSLGSEADAESQSSVLATTGLRAALEWPVFGGVFVRAGLDGAVVLSRVSLRVEGVELWSTPALIAGAHLGVGVEL